MCLTNQLTNCKNKCKGLFCHIHITKCNRINFEMKEKCRGNTITLLSPIKSTNFIEVWFCCFKSTLAVFKNYKNSFLCNELQILRECNHRNVVKILGSGKINNDYYFVTKCYEGDLSNFPNFSENVFKTSHFQMIRALIFLQKKSITHSDIHPRNIFWTKKGQSFLFVLGDFEFGKSFTIENLITGKSYGKRIFLRNKYLSFSDCREHIYSRIRRKGDEVKKYVTSIKVLKESIPLDYHYDLLCLKRCYHTYNFKTSYYKEFINNFVTFCFSKPFVTSRKELFLAEELYKLMRKFPD